MYLPIVSGKVTDDDAAQFGDALAGLPGPVLAYCRTGTRSATLWSLSQSTARSLADILAATKAAGYDMGGVVRRIVNGGKTPTDSADARFEVVIIGGGAGGIAAAASLKARAPDLDIAIIDPADVHYYQPGWTMVGGGIFDAQTTSRTMGSLIPKDVHWIKAAVAAFEPDNNAVVLDGCRVVKYDRLIVCPGIKLDWNQVEGLVDTLGANGVTSNYRYDLAPYTWKLVQNMTSGRAIFTQPPMPIKCAGAPQKAMYLSGDAWHRRGVLNDIDIQFNNAGGVLFGVKDYVPALMKYVEKYDANLNFFHTLVAVDGPAKTAWFDVAKPDMPTQRISMDFDMMHVCPPQTAPDFIRVSPLADVAGWVDVDQATLRHKTYDNIWSLGDVMNAPNAKTMAAARIQAPVVAANIIADIRGGAPVVVRVQEGRRRALGDARRVRAEGAGEHRVHSLVRVRRARGSGGCRNRETASDERERFDGSTGSTGAASSDAPLVHRSRRGVLDRVWRCGCPERYRLFQMERGVRNLSRQLLSHRR